MTDFAIVVYCHLLFFFPFNAAEGNRTKNAPRSLMRPSSEDMPKKNSSRSIGDQHHAKDIMLLQAAVLVVAVCPLARKRACFHAVYHPG